MQWTKLQLLSLISFACFLSVSAGGKKDYGEECSVTSQITNIFTKDENDDPNACNTDNKLVCLTGTCKCNPSLVYEKGYVFGLFGSGCKGAANLPCTTDGTPCVSNSKCEGSSISICKCYDGYHMTTDGYCSNGANSIGSISPIYLLFVIGSYFLFAK